jgi:hypothetical protein
LGKAALTLGDNCKVGFSRAMIFMTNNLGAEMSSPMSPHLRFNARGGYVLYSAILVFSFYSRWEANCWKPTA